MAAVFLDTGYLLALQIANDQYHVAAREHWSRVSADGMPEFVTTTFVFGEAVTYLNSRNLYTKAVELGNDLLQSPNIDLIHVEAEVFGAAWQLLIQQSDKRYSLTDCASFVLMRRLGISTAFTFDHHFRQAGFQTEP
jgi:uncharacterized protein